MLASDFFTVDLLDGTTAYVLAVIEHATRRIPILGVKFPVRDRDTKLTTASRRVASRPAEWCKSSRVSSRWRVPVEL